MPYREASVLMDPGQIDEALSRMAREVAARESPAGQLALVGIRSRGVPLALRLASRIGAVTGSPPPVGVLDITLYRDDLSDIASQPVVRETRLPFPIRGRRILLVDDVLFTGRTVRAAIDQLIDFGRPERIELLVLVDRGGRELPIQADYVGLVARVPAGQMVQVYLAEEDGRDQVVLLQEEGARA
jgi:pyrimidine operon attenuation protein/uracil phosphoribosyltransferase